MSENGTGYSKLMLAVEEKNLEYAEVLLSSGINVNERNKAGQSALILAVKAGRLNFVKLLIRNGADVQITNKLGQTALFVACYYNHEDLVACLLKNKADVNTSDKRGWTPLMIACHYGYASIVKLLMEHGADILAEDSFGKSAIDRANSPEIYKILSLYAQRELQQYIPNEIFKLITSPSDFQVQSHTLSTVRLQETARTVDSVALSKQQSMYSPRTKQDCQEKTQCEHRQQPSASSHNESDRSHENEDESQNGSVRNAEKTNSSNSKLKRAVSPVSEERMNSSRSGAQQATARDIIAKKAPAKQKSVNSSKQSMSESQTVQQNPSEHKMKLKENKPQNFSKGSKTNELPSKSISVTNLLKANSPSRKLSDENKCKDSQRKLVAEEQNGVILHLDFLAYLKDYSQRIQQNIKQKLSYSLAFEIKKNVIEYRQQIKDSLFENLKKMHLGLLYSLRKSSKSEGLAAAVNKYQLEFEENFDQMLLASKTNAKDQKFLDVFYIQAEELDLLLAKEADDRFLKADHGTLSDEENELGKSLREQFSQDIRESFAEINNIVAYEFSKMSASLKTILNENAIPNFQKLIESIKTDLQEEDFAQESSTEAIDNKFLEDQFPEPIEKLPKQQPEVFQLDFATQERQNIAQHLDILINQPEDLNLKSSQDIQEEQEQEQEQEQPQLTENKPSKEPKRKRSFGTELYDLGNIIPFGYYPNKFLSKKTADFSCETFGMNHTSQASCQLNQNSELANGSGLDGYPSNTLQLKHHEKARIENVENDKEHSGSHLHHPILRKKCFGIKPAENYQIQSGFQNPTAQIHGRVTFANKSQGTSNPTDASYHNKQCSNLVQSLHSDSNYETTNEVESCLGRNEETILVQSFTNLAESHKKDLQPRQFTNPDSAFKGIIQRLELPPTIIEADALYRLGNTSPRPPLGRDTDPIRTQNSQLSARLVGKDSLARDRPETQEDYKRISLHTEDYRISEMIEEGVISKSNDSIEETRFHHDTLPPYEVSKENFSISSGSPDLDIIKALQRSNQVLKAVKNSLHASKGRFYNTSENEHDFQSRALSPREYTTNEKWGSIDPLSHRSGQDKIFVSENFNTQEEADQPQNLSQKSNSGPVLLPTLPLPIASSQIKNQMPITNDSPIGYPCIPGMKVESYFKRNPDFTKLEGSSGREGGLINHGFGVPVSFEQRGCESMPNSNRGRLEGALDCYGKYSEESDSQVYTEPLAVYH